MSFDSIFNFISSGISNLLEIIPFVIFIAIIIGYLIGFSFIIYHLVKFGIGIATKFLAIAFTVISIILLTLLIKSYLSLDLKALFQSLFNFIIP